MSVNTAIAPIMIDLVGTSISEVEKEQLQHPQVGGVILFSRNFVNLSQVTELVRDIRECSPQPLLICVDHEGGRVQRFKQGFVHLPALGTLADYDQPTHAAYYHAYLMAAELISIGIDFSFAPVLDVNYDNSVVIGDRSLSADVDELVLLAEHYIKGMHDAGMATTGKHYPGHGFVAEDSHHELPVDTRSFAEIEGKDMRAFSSLFHHSLDALMPAHVIYPEVDNVPVGFSRKWLQEILRGKLAYHGVIFSDDLSMQGAASMGGIIERTEAALEAGCDMVLLCNAPASISAVLDHANVNASVHGNEQSHIRLGRMRARQEYTRDKLLTDVDAQAAYALFNA